MYTCSASSYLQIPYSCYLLECLHLLYTWNNHIDLSMMCLLAYNPQMKMNSKFCDFGAKDDSCSPRASTSLLQRQGLVEHRALVSHVGDQLSHGFHHHQDVGLPPWLREI